MHTRLKFTGRNRNAIDGIPVVFQIVPRDKVATIREGKRNRRLGHSIGGRIQITRSHSNTVHLFAGDLVSIAIRGIRSSGSIHIDVDIWVLIRAENLRDFLVQNRILITSKWSRHLLYTFYEYFIHPIFTQYNQQIRNQYPMV